MLGFTLLNNIFFFILSEKNFTPRGFIVSMQ
jgi:hypothetical protein